MSTNQGFFYRCTQCQGEYGPDQQGMCSPCQDALQAGDVDQLPTMHQIEQANRQRAQYQYVPVRWISKTQTNVWPWDDSEGPLSITMGPGDSYQGETRAMLTGGLDQAPPPPVKGLLPPRRKGRKLTSN